jgi:hypothetical protein
VERPEAVPVEKPKERGGLEDRRLCDDRPARAGLDLELEPRATGHAHLGAEPKQAVLLERLDAPEVERVPDPEQRRVAPAPPQAGTAGEHVEQTAEPPEERALVPPRRRCSERERP